MDTILKVIVLLASAWLAYVVARGERSGRVLSPSAVIGVFVVLFGSIAFGLLRIEAYFSPKLIDVKKAHILSGSVASTISGAGGVLTVSDASDGSLLFAGIVVLAALVVLALDLLGKIDVMSKLDAAMGNTASRPSAGPGAD